MFKHRIIFFLTFIGTFLVTPIYVNTYVGGIELGIESSWKLFGGFMLLYYTFGYPSYFGALHLLSNFVLLIFTSLLIARLLTFLFIQTHKQAGVSIFWSAPYLKKLFRQVVISVVVGIVIFLLTSFLLSPTGLINWLVALPVTLFISFIAIVAQSFRGNIVLTKLQKLLLLIESVIFVLGIIGLSIVVLYFSLG